MSSTMCAHILHRVEAVNPSVPEEGVKIKIRQLALTDFHWLNLQRK